MITGASSGIGHATALELSKHHNKIAIVARREELLKETAAEIEKNGSECIYFAGDACDEKFAAKGAIRLFMETADMEMQHFGIKHIRLQTIHPGFVDTLACKDDGIPENNLISEEQAAEYIIKGYEKNLRENMFPFSTAIATSFARRLAPKWLTTKVELGEVPKEY